MLFARANRVLKDQEAAQEVTLAVIDELALAGKMTKLALARRGRDLVRFHCVSRGAKIFDSITPGDPPKSSR